jgi:regulator of replication initiation timing
MNARLVRLILLLLSCSCALAQEPAATSATNTEAQLTQAVQQLQEQIARLQNSVAELHDEADRYRAETQKLEHRLEAIQANQAEAMQSASPSASGIVGSNSVEQSPSASANLRLSRLEDEYGLLTGKVDDQYQTKVESASKYRVRLSGLVMLNLFANRGVPDSIDTPGVSVPGGVLDGRGSFAGSLRQSQIGLEAFGPEWAGAKVTGDLRFDFAGGFPDTENGVTLGLMRLRTGNVRFNWSHTSLSAGQDSPMFSPFSPTSVIALAQPEFSYTGNLWTWVPQLQLQHWIGLGAAQRLTFAAGILDPLTGEPPRSQFDRAAQAGEVLRQPGYSARVGWANPSNEDRPVSLTIGGYFSPQNWGFERRVDGWAATADWQLPLLPRLSMKGEFYRGKALGGFGASNGQSVLSSDVLQNRFAVVEGLDTVGGWTQASFQAMPTLQINAGYGLDNPFSAQIRRFASRQNLLNPELGRNSSEMTNVIYRPRSDLLFSIEYRHFMSSRLTNVRASTENIGMGIGLLF